LKGPATAVAENRLLIELDNSVQQSPSWEVNSYSCSQEIAPVLWNLRFITMFTRAHHLFLPWARSNQSLSTHLIS